MKLAATHPITGRQWELTDDHANAIWPDCTIVVAFSERVGDATGKVANPVPGVSVQGGYTVTSTLEHLELTDLVQGTTVPGVTAVWGAAPDGGDTPALHVLGHDPFAWLTPHLDVPASTTTTSPPWRDQRFGLGPPALLAQPTRFGELTVTPGAPQARLLPSPVALLPERVLRAPEALLSFAHPSGEPIRIDGLQLAVITAERGMAQLDDLGDPWAPGPITRLGPDLFLVVLAADVEHAPLSEIANPWPGAIAFVRYRQAAMTTTSPERITLQPGHYELELRGTTSAAAPAGLPGAAPVPWSLRQRFWVDAPPSLRPYVKETTAGDDRAFGRRAGFDPTLAGVGFPAHRGYATVVGFRVPYVQDVFPTLRLAAVRSDGATTAQDVAVGANAAGTSTLPAASQAYHAAHGGTVGADDEARADLALTPGPATLHLRHPLPGGGELELDAWAIHVSRFGGAAEQLAWTGTAVTRGYGPSGPVEHEACSPVAARTFPWLRGDGRPAVLRASDVPARSLPAPALDAVAATLGTSLAGRLLDVVDGGPFHPLPDEHVAPPADWLLDPPLAELTGPLDATAAQRFLRFLHRSGVRLKAGGGPALTGVADPVDATRVEAVCGHDGRPLALWLRTPEPLDWRRVGASCSVRHVSPDGGCPSGYARRRRLETAVRLLPGPDGTGALLVAEVAGAPIRFPRGEVTVTLRYHPETTGLVALRPMTPLPGGVEEAVLTFLQPFGRTWPLPPSTEGGRPWDGVVIDLDELEPVLRWPPRPGPPIPDPAPFLPSRTPGGAR